VVSPRALGERRCRRGFAASWIKGTQLPEWLIFALLQNKEQQWRVLVALPLARRKSPLRGRLKIMKFQAHIECKVPKRERKIYKLDGNFDRQSSPAVIHLIVLHHLMVHIRSLFGASVVLLGELWSPKSPFSAVFLVSQKHLYRSLGYREALPLFPFCAHQTLFTLFSVLHFSEASLKSVTHLFFCFFLFPHLLWAERTSRSFSHSQEGTFLVAFKVCSNNPDHTQTIKEDLGRPIIREQRAIADREGNSLALHAWMRAA